MKKTALTVLLALGCVGLGALYLVERGRRPARADEPRPAIPNATAGDTDRVKQLEAELEEREIELAGLRRELTADHGEDEVVVVDVPGAGDDDEVVTEQAAAAATNLPKGLAGMIQQAISSALGATNMGTAASLRELMDGAASGSPSRQRRLAIYEDLIKSLGLDEEKAAAFRELLSKQSGGISFRVMGADGELHDELEGMLGSLSGRQDSAIRELLGDEDFAKYQSFAETESARMVVSEFEDRLSADNLALGEDQRNALIELFQSVRTVDQEGATDLNDGLSFNLDGEQPLDDKVEGSLDSLVARYDAVAKDAEAVLSDEQSANLRSYLNQKLEHKEMEGELAREFLNNVNIQGIPGGAVQGSVRVMGPGMSVGVISSSSKVTLPAAQKQTIQIKMGGDAKE